MSDEPTDGRLDHIPLGFLSRPQCVHDYNYDNRLCQGMAAKVVAFDI